MRVETPSATYEIEFEHPTVKIVLPGPLTIERRETLCKIYLVLPSPIPEYSKVPLRELYAKGRAKCHAGDQFNKATGRKVALEYALFDAKLGRADRKLFWTAYHNRGLVVPAAALANFTRATATVH